MDNIAHKFLFIHVFYIHTEQMLLSIVLHNIGDYPKVDYS